MTAIAPLVRSCSRPLAPKGPSTHATTPRRHPDFAGASVQVHHRIRLTAHGRDGTLPPATVLRASRGAELRGNPVRRKPRPGLPPQLSAESPGPSVSLGTTPPGKAGPGQRPASQETCRSTEIPGRVPRQDVGSPVRIKRVAGQDARVRRPPPGTRGGRRCHSFRPRCGPPHRPCRLNRLVRHPPYRGSSIAAGR